VTRVVFSDTSAWLPVLGTRVHRHEELAATWAALVEKGFGFVTTNLVVAEVHALVLRERGPAAGVQVLDGLYADPHYQVRFVDRELEVAATDRWLRVFRDQRFSLTDAVSFEVMRRERIRQAFATDRHFAAAGYELVP
jgi:predicted nucleic acid-binding protein